LAELLRVTTLPASVITANLAGEALPDVLVERIYGTTQVDKVYNHYGPTETFYSTYTLVQRGCPVTIGRPIANTQCYILDASRNPVPIGVTGELYLAGSGLAHGYYRRPELTNERFVSNPFSQEREGRMYRTGDLCRWLPDGNIQYLGRIDHQIKLRGFRIELGEIEARLAEHPAVREAVVIAREDTPGDKRLVAYYTASLVGEPEAETVGAEQLRSHLSASLPEYMIPAAYVRLDDLPRTPNGKLDRKALPAPEADAYSTRSYEPPQGETEMEVAAIWTDVLKLERVGRQDNFFKLGGHSLAAVQVVTRLRQALSVELTIRDLFAHPVLHLFAEHMINLRLAQFSPEDIARALKLMQST
jgi:acyl-coenzyme A synthetase/AMP-(fatty) acid ligase/acyl carrier protein